MGFQGTTESLFQSTEEMDIQRETQLAHFLITYDHQLETDGQTPDVDLLRQAEVLLQERLQKMPIDQELAHIGAMLYCNLGRWDDLCSLLSKYREQGLPSSEEAWAWWTTNDSLALACKQEESVEQQLALFSWARQQFSLEQCLFVFNDATQAGCWGEIGQRDRWFALFEEIMSTIHFTAQNREDRFLSIRTAIIQHLRVGKEQAPHALPFIQSLYQLIEEDPDWERAEDIQTEIQAIHLKALGILEETAQVRAIGQQATQHLFAWIQRLHGPSIAEKRQLRRLCHNIAASLYWAQQYDLAIPLFEQAAAYGTMSPYTYLWLAASLWATTRDKERTLALLAQARSHDASDLLAQQIVELPEFRDLLDNAEFQEAFRGQLITP